MDSIKLWRSPNPLCDITYGGRHLTMTDFLTSTPDADKPLTDFKQALSSFPCLPFLNLFVSKCNGFYDSTSNSVTW